MPANININPPRRKMSYKVGDIVLTLSRPDLLYEICSLNTVRQGDLEEHCYYEDVAILKSCASNANCLALPFESRCIGSRRLSYVGSLFCRCWKPARIQPESDCNDMKTLQYYDNSNDTPWVVFVTEEWFIMECGNYSSPYKPARWYDFFDIFWKPPDDDNKTLTCDD